MSADKFHYLFVHFKKQLIFTCVSGAKSVLVVLLKWKQTWASFWKFEKSKNLLLNKLKTDNRHLIACLETIFTICWHILKKNNLQLCAASKITNCGFVEVKTSRNAFLKNKKKSIDSFLRAQNLTMRTCLRACRWNFTTCLFV